MKNTIETLPFTPTRPAMRAMLAVACVLVLTIGMSLFVFSEQTEIYFAWTIQSFITAGFLGAAYLAAAVLELLSARERVWANGRIAVPAVLVFTTLTLVISLLHLDRFHFNAPWIGTVIGTWVWLLVYATVPLILAVFWLFQAQTRGIDPSRAQPLPAWYGGLCVIAGVEFIALGIGMLFLLEHAINLWPWALTPLTARAIGAWLVGWGVAMGHIAWENDARRVRPALISMIVLCALQALVLVRYPAAVDWASPNTLVYGLTLGLLLLMSIIGLSTPARAGQSNGWAAAMNEAKTG